ncbi:MAG: HemK family protein methyltransferase [Cellvibrio sp.]
MSQENNFQLLLKRLQNDLSILPDKSEENPDNTLKALWQAAAGRKVSPIIAESLELPVLSDEQFATLNELVTQRLQGIPLAHITERQHFLGMEYIVGKGLYIPRKETELLASTAIDVIEKKYSKAAQVNLIDLCTGIGTVALSVAYHCNQVNVFGSDIYTPAIAAAHINTVHFGLSDRAAFHNADLFSPFANMQGEVDIITCCPPYITSAKVKNMAQEIAQHEPEEAFNAGPFGLSVFNQLIELAPTYLRVGGFLIFECGLGQGEFLARRIAANKHYKNIEQVCDENANVRVLKAETIAV